MSEYPRPGTYIEEVDSGSKPIEAVSTSACGFIGLAKKGKLDTATLVTSWQQFIDYYGGFYKSGSLTCYLPLAVYGFFSNGGKRAYINRVDASTAAASASTIAVTGSVTANTFSVYAINEGAWGNNVKVVFDNRRMAETSTTVATTTGGSIVTLSSVENIYPGSILSIVTGTTLSAAISTTTATGLSVTLGSGFASGNTIRIDEEIMICTAAGTATGLTVSRGASGSTATVHSAGAKVLNLSAGCATKCVAEVSATSKNVTIDQTWGAVIASGSTVFTNEFRMKVYYNGDIVETWDYLCKGSDVTNDVHGTNHPNYITTILGQTVSTSNFVYITNTSNTTDSIPLNIPATNSTFTLASGSDGTFSSVAVADFDTTPFNTVENMGMICAPDSYNLAATGTTAVINALNTFCEGRRYTFAIHSTTNLNTSTAVSDAVGQVSGMVNASSYGAIYFPWIEIENPATASNIQVPPIGHIAGIYAKTDIQDGVHYTPAGESKTIAGCIKPAYKISDTDNGTLFAAKINSLRSFASLGTVVWGGRTLSANASWRYINVRRWMAMVEESIATGTRFAVFMNNNAKTWNKVKTAVTSFLQNEFIKGAMAGDTVAKSYYVKCDDTTNTQTTIDVGQLITEVGVAPNKPAEFVIFRIGMWSGGSSISEV